MRVSLDTNVIVYAQGVNGDERAKHARGVLRQCQALGHEIVLPVQVLGELFYVLTRKGRFTPEHSARIVDQWLQDGRPVATTVDVFNAGCTLASVHGLQIWDAIILAAAASAGCDLLLSEDMHDGLVWRGTTVRNPFAPGFSLG